MSNKLKTFETFTNFVNKSTQSRSRHLNEEKQKTAELYCDDGFNIVTFVLDDADALEVLGKLGIPMIIDKTKLTEKNMNKFITPISRNYGIVLEYNPHGSTTLHIGYIDDLKDIMESTMFDVYS